MKAPPTVTSALMRRFRLQRKLTLEIASQQLRTSTAVLSRLECGMRHPTRDELLSVGEVYALSPWEAHSLLISAGYLPDAPVGFKSAAMRREAMRSEVAHWKPLLCDLPWPAFVMDGDGYMVMWNGQLRTLWMGETSTRTHVLESIWCPRARAILGEGWAQQMRHAIWGFYLFTITSLQGRTNAAVMQYLAESCGDEFVDFWNRSIAEGDDGHTGRLVDKLGMEIVYPTVAGTVRYLVTQVGSRPATAHALYAWLPQDVEGAERNLRITRAAGREVILGE